MNQYYDQATMDTLLSRDEFVEDDMIDEVLDCAGDEAWEWVYANREKYSQRVRMRIEPEDFRPAVEKLKVKVVELTDKEWDRIKEARRKVVEESFEKDWLEYSATLQDRFMGAVDSQLDDAWDKLSAAKNAYMNYPEHGAVKKKYVAPGSKSKPTVDANQEVLKKEVEEAENEYDLAQKAVDLADELYWEDKRTEYRKTWMPSV